MQKKQTKEEKELVKNKLDYLELDLNDIPSGIKEYIPLEFKPSRTYDDVGYKVYKYVDVRKIQILLTDKNRLDPLNEKISHARPIEAYLEPKDENDMIRHTIFLKMLKDVNIDKVEEIEEEQKQFLKSIPFKVKYQKNFLWQIFYDIYTQQYFMLVPTQDKEYEAFFYLLKQKLHCLKTKRAKKIYIPISYIDYNNPFLSKSQIDDLEKYLWLFTKDWPMVYEVYDKKDNLSIHVVGNTRIYEKIKSVYKVELKDKDEANNFYKLLKALFILQTELPHEYNFETKISSNGGLEFLYRNRIIEYDNLSRIVKEDFLEYKTDIEELTKILKKEEEELEKISKDTKQKEKDYLFKEKQIATYMECKKSFFGKVKYFFKSKKLKKQEEAEKSQSEEKEETTKIDMLFKYEEKENYTIDELIQICQDAEERQKREKNISLDKKAMIDKNERITRKLKNANLYIEEIENHKKSIFDFWRFSNKDEMLSLTEGEVTSEKEQISISKTFDYEMDAEEFGIRIDKKQRSKISDKECEIVFLTDTEVLEDINKCRNNEKVTNLKILKDEKNIEDTKLEKEEFDVFGSITEDKTKIKNLGNKKHRELPRNKFKILDINKNTTDQEYINKVEEITNQLDKILDKNEIDCDLSVYLSIQEKLNTNDIKIVHLNPENALEDLKNEDKVNLYRLNLKQGTKIIALTNNIYYDNKNKTLPEGMDVSDKLLIDLKKYKLDLKKQRLFRMNQMISDLQVSTKIVCVYEYDVV